MYVQNCFSIIIKAFLLTLSKVFIKLSVLFLSKKGCHMILTANNYHSKNTKIIDSLNIESF